MLKQNRYFLLENNYVIDLINVDFITFKENEKRDGEYWLKFHLGTKECRYKAEGQEEVVQILKIWSTVHGQELNLEEYEIGGFNGTNF